MVNVVLGSVCSPDEPSEFWLKFPQCFFTNVVLISTDSFNVYLEVISIAALTVPATRNTFNYFLPLARPTWDAAD